MRRTAQSSYVVFLSAKIGNKFELAIRSFHFLEECSFLEVFLISWRAARRVEVARTRLTDAEGGAVIDLWCEWAPQGRARGTAPTLWQYKDFLFCHFDSQTCILKNRIDIL